MDFRTEEERITVLRDYDLEEARLDVEIAELLAKKAQLHYSRAFFGATGSLEKQVIPPFRAVNYK